MNTEMTPEAPTALQRLLRLSLISQIAIGLVLGMILAMVAPEATKAVAILGDLFIAGLKSVVPVLVFVLMMASIASQSMASPPTSAPS